LLDKAAESLRAARVLAEQDLFDFAVSRAYYAMFYVADAPMLGEGLAFSKHSAVIAAFGERFSKTERVPREYRRFLIEGQDSRNVGDYGLGPGFSRDQALEQIHRGEQFLAMGAEQLR